MRVLIVFGSVPLEVLNLDRIKGSRFYIDDKIGVSRVIERSNSDHGFFVATYDFGITHRMKT